MSHKPPNPQTPKLSNNYNQTPKSHVHRGEMTSPYRATQQLLENKLLRAPH